MHFSSTAKDDQLLLCCHTSELTCATLRLTCVTHGLTCVTHRLTSMMKTMFCWLQQVSSTVIFCCPVWTVILTNSRCLSSHQLYHVFGFGEILTVNSASDHRDITLISYRLAKRITVISVLLDQCYINVQWQIINFLTELFIQVFYINLLADFYLNSELIYIYVNITAQISGIVYWFLSLVHVRLFFIQFLAFKAQNNNSKWCWWFQ